MSLSLGQPESYWWPTSETAVEVGKDSIMIELERFKRMFRILHDINQSLVDIFRYARALV